MNLAAFGVHHDGDGEALLVVEAADAVDDGLVPVPGAMAHVESGHVHASHGQGLQLLEPARGRPNCAHQLRPPRAAEAVLLQLRLRHGVHLDGGGIGGRGGGAVVVGHQHRGAEAGEAASEREGRGRQVEAGGNGGGRRGEEVEGVRE